MPQTTADRRDMTGGPLPGGPEIIELSSVPGFVVFDLPGVPESAGGTRLAPEVRVGEVALLARAMAYKFAALGVQTGGARAGVGGDRSDRRGKASLMARFCAEIAPLADSGRLLTGPDMGTAEEDFAPPGVRVIAPAANVPYTAPGADVLAQRGIVALPDFVCNAGAVIGYRSAHDATPDQVLADVETTISGLIREALGHPSASLAGACDRAGQFLRGWWGEPPSPPYAPQS